MILGIDPGISGALALLDDDDNVLFVRDMPTSAKTNGKGQQVNAYLLNDVVNEAIMITETANSHLHVHIEQVNAMPGQGVTSMFGFGRSLGVIEGIVAACGLRTIFVRPNAWKKQFGLRGKDKDASRTLAIEYHPEIANQLSRKRDCGRADAILIGKYCE